MGEWIKIATSKTIEKIGNGTSDRQVSYETDFPVTRIETISEGKIDFSRIGFVDRCSESYCLREGDILLSNINSLKHIGKVAFFEDQKRLYHGMNLLLLRFKNDYDKKFLFYFLSQNKNWFEKMAAQAINQASINQTTIGDLELFLPKSKPEQTRIAEILSTADEAIAHTEALIAKYQRIKTGLMQDLLTKGIDENGNIRSKETHKFVVKNGIEVPEDWEVKSFKQLLIDNIISDIQDGNHGEKHPRSSDFVTEGISFIMASDISKDEIDIDNCKKISYEQYQSLRIGFAKPQDVLLSHKASIGFVTIVPESMPQIMLTPQVTYYRIKDKDSLYYKFLCWYMRGQDFQNELSNLAKQSTRDYIGILMQQNLKIAFPKNLKEQKLISEKFESIEIFKKKENLILKKRQSLKIGLMQDLLSGKVRVKI